MLHKTRASPQDNCSGRSTCIGPQREIKATSMVTSASTVVSHQRRCKKFGLFGSHRNDGRCNIQYGGKEYENLQTCLQSCKNEDTARLLQQDVASDRGSHYVPSIIFSPCVDELETVLMDGCV